MGTSFLDFPRIDDDTIADSIASLHPTTDWVAARAKEARIDSYSQWRGIVLLYECFYKHDWMPNEALVLSEFAAAESGDSSSWDEPEEAWARIVAMKDEMLERIRFMREGPQPKPAGLYGKYTVTRNDGTDKKGGKHHGCDYFVLDMTHDPHALAALNAYAESCKGDYPELAKDLREALPQPLRNGLIVTVRNEDGSILTTGVVIDQGGSDVDASYWCYTKVKGDDGKEYLFNADPALHGYKPIHEWASIDGYDVTAMTHTRNGLTLEWPYRKQGWRKPL